MEGSVLGAVRNDVVVPFEAWEKSAPTKRPNSGHEALGSTTNMKHGKVQGACTSDNVVIKGLGTLMTTKKAENPNRWLLGPKIGVL